MSPHDNWEAKVWVKLKREFSVWFEFGFFGFVVFFFKSQCCLMISSFHNQKVVKVSLCPQM